jgi:hypothetical protein
MLKPAISLVISAALFAGAALAEPAPAPAAATPVAPSAAAPMSAKPAAAGGKTVEGVTVTGKALPKTECSPRDQACIRIVVAELKRLYPEQLKRFCFQRQMQAMAETLQFGDADPGRPPQTGMTFTRAAPLAIACASDPK